MSHFIIECPECHRYSPVSDGFFAQKKIQCACGNVIDVKTDRMASRHCASCGNDVVFDQKRGRNAKCPVCQAPLMTDDTLMNRADFVCPTCGCSLQADKSAAMYTCPVCDTKIDVQREVKLADQKKDGLPSVIRYEGDNTALVWKHPLTDFAMGSQLIVHESQEAIFFKNGEALDSFPAGRYTLETGVLPKMDRLSRLPVAGQMFHAEVYFVNLVTLMNVKWGTSSKVGLFDPISGIHVELGASGAFNLRVTDARRLLLRLVGTTDALTLTQLFGGDTGYFRALIMTRVKSNLARVIRENQINVLEIDTHLDTISRALRAALNENLAEYGLTLVEFFVTGVVTPDDDPNYKRLKQQHADLYLKVREEQIRKAEAEAAFERRAVEAQTAARMKVIGAQGDADVVRVKAQAEAEAYRMQAEAEAQEMRMKGFTYQQETARQVGLEAMRHEGGAGGLSGMTGDLMGMGVGLGAMSGVIGMTRDALNPALSSAMNMGAGPAQSGTWDCACGQKGVSGNFCANCGAKRPVPAGTWDCACGQKGITGNFCGNCGAKRPEAVPGTWDCACGKRGITGAFCTECGKKKGE